MVILFHSPRLSSAVVARSYIPANNARGSESSTSPLTLVWRQPSRWMRWRPVAVPPGHRSPCCIAAASEKWICEPACAHFTPPPCTRRVIPTTPRSAPRVLGDNYPTVQRPEQKTPRGPHSRRCSCDTEAQPHATFPRLTSRTWGRNGDKRTGQLQALFRAERGDGAQQAGGGGTRFREGRLVSRPRWRFPSRNQRRRFAGTRAARAPGARPQGGVARPGRGAPGRRATCTRARGTARGAGRGPGPGGAGSRDEEGRAGPERARGGRVRGARGAPPTASSRTPRPGGG